MLDVLLLSLTALFFFFLVCCVPFFFLLCSLIFCKQLKFGVDESYKLSVPATGNPMYAQIEVSKLLTADVFACDCTKENEILVYRKPEKRIMYVSMWLTTNLTKTIQMVDTEIASQNLTLC